MTYQQMTLPVIEVNDVIFDLIENWSLVTLPVHIGKDVRVGNLICFETREILNWSGEFCYIYAIVEETSHWKGGQTFSDRLTHNLVRFRVLGSIDSVEIN